MGTGNGDQEAGTAPALFGDGREAFACARGDLVLSEKAESCSLLAASLPSTDGSEAALKVENGKSGEGRVGRTRLKCSLAGREFPSPSTTLSPMSHMLGTQVWRGTSSRSIPGRRGDCREHIPGKGKECGERKEKEECPHRQSLLLGFTDMDWRLS